MLDLHVRDSYPYKVVKIEYSDITINLGHLYEEESAELARDLIDALYGLAPRDGVVGSTENWIRERIKECGVEL